MMRDLALAAFWEFYEPRSAAITDDLRRAIGELPAWQQVIAAEPAHVAELRQQRVHASMRDAFVNGSWDAYAVEMRALGRHYASSGIDFAAWFERVTVSRDVVRRHMRAAVADQLARASTVADGLTRWLDFVIVHVGEAYIARSNEALAQEEGKYRALFEYSTVPMWTFDRATLRFLTVNEAAVRLYGYTREEFAAMTVADIRPAEDLADLHAAVVGPPDAPERRRWRHRTKDGRMLTTELKLDDFVSEGRNVRLVHVHDVTDREGSERALREKEDQLRHAQKMDAIGTLASGVAHDFNNILMVIGTSATLLDEALAPDDPNRSEVTEISRAADRAAALTRHLLAMSRHSAAAPRPVDVNDVTAGFAPMLRRLVGARIVVDHRAADVPMVHADPHQLEQVLMNLAVNARDAMPDGGRLAIETETVQFDLEQGAARSLAAGRYVAIVVTDTGTGMDADTQRRIFEPFFTTKQAGRGTGLGLSIVHGIVAQAGGTISVFSAPGHGSTFRVYLPVARDGVAAVEPAPAVSGPRTLPAMTILVVEPDDHVRNATARVLEAAGCRVVHASTAADARRICVSHEDDLPVAIVELLLPDGRGDRLATELRELRPALAVVLTSGYPAATLEAARASWSVMLTKPFSPAELRAAVAVAVAVPSGDAAEREHVMPVRHRVLVADDDDELLRALVRFLTRRLDLDITAVGTGSAAIEALGGQRFDAVLADVHMPGASGLDLLRAVRRVDLDVPVILMSGEPDVSTATAAVEYGAFRYLVKPLELAAVDKLLGHAIRAHALARLRRDAMSLGGVHAGAADRVGLEVRFERALDSLWLAHQPIVEAATSAVYGFEVLVRSDEVSMATPDLLITAATQLGRLAQLGRRVRELAAAAIAARVDAEVMFVNLHPTDLIDLELVSETAPLTTFAPRVVLEVTERASLESSAAVLARLERLRALGFRLAVDDIGAGYSGLTSFADLTPELVKIDMSLVRNVHLSVVRQRTIRSLCTLCHEGGSLVVGEGVETEAERECLAALGCDLLQGYLLGRPTRARRAAF